MASRSLDVLKPVVREKTEEFLKRCKERGLDVLIYCTQRSFKEQDELYAMGRTKPGKIVTNARAGDSWHNWNCAFDFVPLINGKPQWGNKELYKECGEIAEACGLEWSGRWKGALKETAHCQYTGGLTLAQVKAGAEIA